MFGLGPTELLVIFVLALLVLGPEKIPTAAAQLGKAIRNFRKVSQDLRDQVDEDGQLGRSFTDLHSALRGDVSILEPKSLNPAAAAPLSGPPIQATEMANGLMESQSKQTADHG